MYRVATGLGWGWAVADCLAVPAGPCPNYRPAHRHPRKQLAADRPRGGKRTGSLHWRRTARPSARPANRCPTHRKKSHILQARRSNIIKNNEFGSTFHISDLKNHMMSFFRPREHPRRRPARRPTRHARRPTRRPPLKQPATVGPCGRWAGLRLAASPPARPTGPCPTYHPAHRPPQGATGS